MSQQLRLVIADDESLIRMNLKETLVGLGYLVVGEAADGISAINLTRELQPDLVIMDVKMPRLDGSQAAKQIAEERIAPVLLLTAYSGREQIEQQEGVSLDARFAPLPLVAGNGAAQVLHAKPVFQIDREDVLAGSIHAPHTTLSVSRKEIPLSRNAGIARASTPRGSQHQTGKRKGM